MTARYDMSGWCWLPLPARILRLRTGGAIETLDDRSFALDVKADFDSTEVLISLDMTTDPDANGIRRIGSTGLRPQVSAALMETAYAALCQALGVRAGGDAQGVYDLRSRAADGFTAVPLEGRFIIKGSATRP